MRLLEAAPRPYARQGHDVVRRTFEERFVETMVRGLLDVAPGAALLDLGCGDGLVARLAGRRLTGYLGLDLDPSVRSHPTLAHDLREGLGPAGPRAFDLYVGTFGIASHMAPREVERLLADIARHARRGSIVALEALGLNSLEWPGLWGAPVGAARTIPYRLGADVDVHPWAPAELMRRFDLAGIAPMHALDRTLQAGPKLSEGRYWPGLPGVRAGLRDLLAGEAAGAPPAALSAPLPRLPASPPAFVHRALAAARRVVARRSGLAGPALARAVWSLEPRSAGGYGHGLLVVGRVR
jgi:SAM-dependent methyltransferase